jgi:hypothetical protein
MKNKIKVTPEILFFVISIIGIIIMVIMLVASDGRRMNTMNYGRSMFCDFWNHIIRLNTYESLYGNLEDKDAIFPPLAYLFLSLFARAVKYESTITEVQTSAYGILVFAMYLVIFSVAFVQVLNYAYKTKNQWIKVFMPFIFILSYPFWGYAFERGNPSIYAMLFLMIGLSFRDHQNKVLREISMICIAISAGFKIYPAIFGLLWLAEKRYKETIRLVIYGLIAFFAPFAFFGGVQGIGEYIGTFMRYAGKGVYARTNIIGNLMNVFPNQGHTIGVMLVLAWCIWIVVYVFQKGFTWRSVALLLSTHTIIIPESYMYTYVFIVIPCVMFLNAMNEKDKYSKLEYIYTLLFAFIFTMPPFGSGENADNLGFYRLYVSWLLVLGLILAEWVADLSYCLSAKRG